MTTKQEAHTHTHTPIPWSWVKNYGDEIELRGSDNSTVLSIEDAGSCCAGTFPSESNAQMIVRAVNSHEALMRLARHLEGTACVCLGINKILGRGDGCLSCKAREAIDHAG